MFPYVGAQRQTKLEIGKFVVTRPLFQLISGVFTYETRRGRESNPRIAVLQTATLPLGYPAVFEETQTIWARRNGVNVESVEPLHR